MEIVAADIGGTHARFAIAEVADGRVVRLGQPVTLKTAEHASLQMAWTAFGEAVGRPLPRAAAIAVATPIAGDVLKMTNNPWIIRPALIDEKLGLDLHVLINDFDAVGHAVARAARHDFRHLCGPDATIADAPVVSIVGPGTGLGVAQLVRLDHGYRVVATEGGHSDFAPLDSIEDAILARLRQRFRRVSVERIVAGPAIVDIYQALAALEGRAVLERDDRSLWAAALAGDDALAAAALDRFCLSLGAVAGDIALTQGAAAVVIAGGLGQRLAEHLPRSGFAQRFVAKGRFEGMMAAMPVALLTMAEPGLFGAAAAFAGVHGGAEGQARGPGSQPSAPPRDDR